MKCLNCSHEMMNYQIHHFSYKVSYDVCESCFGIWADNGEFNKIVCEVEGNLDYNSMNEVENSESPKICPRDGEHLHKVKFLDEDDKILERCRNCNGFWLNGGQLLVIDNEITRLMPIYSRGIAQFLDNSHLPYWRRLKKHQVRKRDSAETDFSLPVIPIQHGKALGRSELKCPECEIAMDSFKAYGMEFQSCNRCHGLWLHSGELKRLKDKVDQDSWGNLRWLNDEVIAIDKTSTMISNKICPECVDQKLVSTNFGNSKIVIDCCKKCHGVWLEKEEYQEIIEYLREELLHLSHKELEQKVSEQVKKIWTDHSEGKFAEILDAKAAISALINLTIFEHPALTQAFLKTGNTSIYL